MDWVSCSSQQGLTHKTYSNISLELVVGIEDYILFTIMKITKLMEQETKTTKGVRLNGSRVAHTAHLLHLTTCPVRWERY
jgi:hypothetical protein